MKIVEGLGNATTDLWQRQQKKQKKKQIKVCSAIAAGLNTRKLGNKLGRTCNTQKRKESYLPEKKNCGVHRPVSTRTLSAKKSKPEIHQPSLSTQNRLKNQSQQFHETPTEQMRTCGTQKHQQRYQRNPKTPKTPKSKKKNAKMA